MPWHARLPAGHDASVRAPPQGLAELGYEIVSTGGSASAIEAAGVPVKRVEELTGFPEMLDGGRGGVGGGDLLKLSWRSCAAIELQAGGKRQGCSADGTHVNRCLAGAS